MRNVSGVASRKRNQVTLPAGGSRMLSPVPSPGKTQLRDKSSWRTLTWRPDTTPPPPRRQESTCPERRREVPATFRKFLPEHLTRENLSCCVAVSLCIGLLHAFPSSYYCVCLLQLETLEKFLRQHLSLENFALCSRLYLSLVPLHLLHFSYHHYYYHYVLYKTKAE